LLKINVKKFHIKFPDLVTPLDRWVAFLTRAHELDKSKMPDTLAEDSAIVKAIEVVDRMFNEEERVMYEARKKTLMDVESRIESALETGTRRGHQRGHQQGLEEG